jgi:hypothetical protein
VRKAGFFQYVSFTSTGFGFFVSLSSRNNARHVPDAGLVDFGTNVSVALSKPQVGNKSWFYCCVEVRDLLNVSVDRRDDSFITAIPRIVSSILGNWTI